MKWQKWVQEYRLKCQWVPKQDKVLKLTGARKAKRTRFEVCKDIFEVLIQSTDCKKPPCFRQAKSKGKMLVCNKCKYKKECDE